QSLANILCDAAFHGIDGKENLKGAVQLRKEGADMFLADGYELNYACEALDIGVMYLELASGSSSKEHLKNALEYLNKAVAIFERENRMIDLGNAKMGIAVVYRNQSNLKKAIETYKEAITIFEKGNNPRYTGHAKLSLAGVYRELSRGSSKKNLKQAEKLEKEAAELLK
ncbi:MAG: tetratricopeptide repeat protein, partial [Candidatus Hydrothermarchaeaceae archaeon]